MISKKTAAKELLKMSLNYSMTRKTAEELEALSELWMEGFIDVSEDVFIDAMKLHRQASNYFPTIKDIADCCSSVWEERRRKVKKLPEPIPLLTPEQIKENAERVRKAMRSKPLPVRSSAEKKDT